MALSHHRALLAMDVDTLEAAIEETQEEHRICTVDEMEELAAGNQEIACSGCGHMHRKAFLVPTCLGHSGLGWQGDVRCLCQDCYAEEFENFLVIKVEGQPDRPTKVSGMTKAP